MSEAIKILAFDLGSSSGRAILGVLENERLHTLGKRESNKVL